MGSKVNANDELRCYSAAWPYVELFPPHASCGMYNVSQASSATGFIRPVHTHWLNWANQHFCDISNTQCKCEKEEVIFLTRSEFFLLSASAYPVAQLDSSITHDCLTRIWDFGFHRFENQNRSIQRGWKCSRVYNNKSIPANIIPSGSCWKTSPDFPSWISNVLLKNTDFPVRQFNGVNEGWSVWEQAAE